MYTEKLKILLIEDNPGDARLIQELLAAAPDAPFILEHVDTLSKGLARLAKGGVDVILLDLSLPDSRGLEGLDKILAQTQAVPIVVLSGLSDEAVAIKAVQTGAQDYLVKGSTDGNLLVRSIRYSIERQRLRVEVRESEARYRLLADNIADIIWTADSEARITYVSPSIKRFLGYTVEEAMRLKVSDILAPDSTDQARRFVKWQISLYARGSQPPPASMTLEHVRKDGSTVWAEVMLSFLQGKDGRIIGIMGATRDITERRKAEEALRESEERLKRYWDSSPDAIYVHDLNGTFLRGNKAGEKLLGYSAEEIEGKSFLELHILPPEYLPKAVELLKLSAKGEPTGPDEFEVIRKDGARVFVEITAYPIMSADKVEVIGIARDITERKRMEDALRHSEERYRELFENANDIIYTHDLAGNFTSINKEGERVTGYMRDEVMEMNISRILTPGSLELARQMMAHKINQGGSTQYELEIVAKDGHRIPLEVSTRLIYEGSKPVGVQGIARDITERKKMEQELLRLSDAVRMSTDSIVVTDLEGKVLDLNEATLKVQGVDSKADLVGLRPFDTIVPEDQGKALEDLAEVMEKGCIRDIQYHLLTRDGRKVLVETSASVMKDKDGQPIGIVAITRDITERKRMEEALRASEEMYRLCFDNASDVIYLVNPEGMLLTISPSVERMLGYTPDELLGHKFLKLNIFSPESLERALADMTRVLAGERVMSSEREFIAKDGTKRFVEINLAPVTSPDGKAVSIMCAARDITERKRMEEALEENEERFRAVFEGTSIGIALVGFDRKVIGINPAFERMLGYSLEEFRKLTNLEYLHPDDAMLDAKLYVDMLKGKRDHYTVDKRYIRKDGQVLWGRQNLSVVRDAGGTPRYFIAMVEDITEHKRMEVALRQSEQDYRTLFDSTIDGMAVIDAETLKVLLINQPILNKYGSGFPGDIFKGDLLDFVHPEDRERVLKLIVEDLFEKDTREVVKFRLVNSEGKVIWVSCMGARIKYQGRLAGLVSLRDITAQQEAEESLRQSEHNYRVLFESTLDGMVVIDGETMEIMFANQTAVKLGGFDSAQDIIGWNPLSYLPPEERERAYKLIKEEVFEKDLHNIHEYRALSKDGEEMWVSVVSTRTELQGRLAALVSLRDITERKRAEEEKRRLEEQIQLAGRLAAVGELAAGVAHELNNPIAAIKGFAQLLAAREDVDVGMKKDLQTIFRESQRASKITQNMLTFARRHEPEKRFIPINEALERTLELRAHQMKLNNIELEEDFDPSLPNTMADFYQMQQVFLNIINNAEQAMVEAHGKGKLIVRTRKVGGMVQINFIDDGPGISEENLKRIFDPFFTTKEVGRGTGLGLSICYGLVEAHCGRIYAKSKLGKGATFVVEIPIVTEEQAEAEVASSNPDSRGVLWKKQEGRY